jgi:glycosyltransferase involved in cell wall biosynthesis
MPQSSAPGLSILQVIPAYYPAIRYGGPVRSVHGLAAALVRRGHRVEVYTTNVDGDRNLAVPLGIPVDLDGVRVSYFQVPMLRRLCWSPALATRLRETMPRFDVAHLHSVYLLPTLLGAHHARRAGVPYVLSPRGMLMRAAIRGRSRWVKSAWIRLIERRSLERAASVHVTADLEANEIQQMGMSLPRICCVPNGVDLPAQGASFNAPAAGLPRPYALFLSRINWKKGLDRLISAWRRVPDLTLVVAGNDEENYTARLRAQAQSLGVAERIYFMGPVADQAKWALYAHAELFVLPSYAENFGNVVAEAMAMSCPVLVSQAVGLAAFVAAAGAGLATDGDPEDIARKVRWLHEHPNERDAMGRRGAAATARQLSWDAVAERMEQLYRSVIDGREGGAATLEHAAG